MVPNKKPKRVPPTASGFKGPDREKKKDIKVKQQNNPKDDNSQKD